MLLPCIYHKVSQSLLKEVLLLVKHTPYAQGGKWNMMKFQDHRPQGLSILPEAVQGLGQMREKQDTSQEHAQWVERIVFLQRLKPRRRLTHH